MRLADAKALIAAAKARIARQQAKEIGWEDIDNNFTKEWYFVQKIMKQRIDGDYPALTFQSITEEILNDPEYKTSDEGRRGLG